MTDGVAGQAARELATEIIQVLTLAGETVAAAESLTGGLVAAALTDVPGSSNAFRGGVVAYATELKAQVLGVDVGMLKRHGPVYAPVAAAMADGVRQRLGATIGGAELQQLAHMRRGLELQLGIARKRSVPAPDVAMLRKDLAQPRPRVLGEEPPATPVNSEDRGHLVGRPSRQGLRDRGLVPLRHLRIEGWSSLLLRKVG